MEGPGETDRVRLTDDDRFDLQFAASSSERRNQPRALVFGAGVLLAGSLLVVMLGRGALARAENAIDQIRADETEMSALLAEVERVDTGGQTLVHDPMTRTKLLIKEATERAGVTGVDEPISGSGRTLEGGVIVREFRYERLRSHSIGVLLGSVRSSLEAIVGLNVESIRLKPGDKEWEMRVVYTRMEKTS